MLGELLGWGMYELLTGKVQNSLRFNNYEKRALLLGAGGAEGRCAFAALTCTTASCSVTMSVLLYELKNRPKNFQDACHWRVYRNLLILAVWFESEWKGSRDAIYSLVTRLWLRRSEVRIPSWTRDLSVLQNIQTGCMAHPSSAELFLRSLINAFAACVGTALLLFFLWHLVFRLKRGTYVWVCWVCLRTKWLWHYWHLVKNLTVMQEGNIIVNVI
jgi:hypothetical protein